MAASQEQMQQATQQAKTVAIPKRWPLVSKLQTRSPSTPLTKDARLINCYAEYDQQDQEHWIYKRLGISTTPTFSFGSPVFGNGIYQSPAFPSLLAIFGSNVYLNNAPLGTIGTSFPVPFTFETVFGPAGGSIAINNGSLQYVVKLQALTITNISGTIPGITGTYTPGWCYLNGTLYIMDTSGNIYGSAINDATTWPGTNIIKASSNADQGVALAKQLTYLVAFKQYTTQVFYDTGQGSPGSTLAPVPDSQTPLGCLGGWTVQNIDNTLLWLTSNQTASPQVVQMDNLVPKIVSTPAVERILDGLSFGWSPDVTAVTGSNTALGGVYAWILKHGGHRFYCLTSNQLNISMVYDIDQQLWYIWTDPNGNYWPYISLSYLPANATVGVQGQHLIQHITNGKIYELDGDYAFPNDAGVLFPVDIYTPNMDFGTDRRKLLNNLYFNADRVKSYLQVRYSDDDYQSFSNFRSVNLNLKKPRLDRCGTFHRRRAYHLRHMANSAFRIKSMDMQMDLGTL